MEKRKEERERWKEIHVLKKKTEKTEKTEKGRISYLENPTFMP